MLTRLFTRSVFVEVTLSPTDFRAVPYIAQSSAFTGDGHFGIRLECLANLMDFDDSARRRVTCHHIHDPGSLLTIDRTHRHFRLRDQATRPDVCGNFRDLSLMCWAADFSVRIGWQFSTTALI